MEKEKIIELLNKDLQDEHGAIIQYLSHAYAMGEGELACEVEGLAREEMRHLDWLAETIVELGGIPSLMRGTMRMGGDSVSDWMGNDVMLEDGAIKQYQEHIQKIDDSRIKRLLQRILSDEKAHKGKFEHFVDKSEREGAKDIRGNVQDDLSAKLNWGVEHEYTVILQYLLHSYMSKNPEVKKQMEDQAINEMQHLGWLAEEMIDGGRNPVIEHTEVDRSSETSDMLRADIDIEKKVANEYGRIAKEVDGAGLRELLTRIRDNEIYHIAVFDDLLKEEEKSK